MFNIRMNADESLTMNGDRAVISAPGQTDYFRDPASDAAAASAPFLATAVNGDFRLSARITPEFGTRYDAGCLFLFADEEHWAKLAFERTDLGHDAVVSVVTRGRSDDCNGEKIEGKSLWLQMVRSGRAVAMHYSLDGRNWRMSRLCALEPPAGLSMIAGLVAQSPVGEGCSVSFDSVQFSTTIPGDIRAGI